MAKFGKCRRMDTQTRSSRLNEARAAAIAALMLLSGCAASGGGAAVPAARRGAPVPPVVEASSAEPAAPRPRVVTTVRVEGQEDPVLVEERPGIVETVPPPGRLADEASGAERPAPAPERAGASGRPSKPETGRMELSRWITVGRIITVDTADRVVIFVADPVPAIMPGEVISRDGGLQPTARLQVLGLRRGGVFAALIRDGDPKPGDEVVFDGLR